MNGAKISKYLAEKLLVTVPAYLLFLARQFENGSMISPALTSIFACVADYSLNIPESRTTTASETPIQSKLSHLPSVVLWHRYDSNINEGAFIDSKAKDEQRG